MKWITVVSGDVRERKVFAWNPMECTDGFTRRFVFLRVREVWSEGYSGMFSTSKAGWRVKSVLPMKHDPEAEAEVAAAKLIRDSRPQTQWGGIAIASAYGIGLGGFFTKPTEEGDEWESTDDEDNDE